VNDATAVARPTEETIERFVTDWYVALDRHDPVEEVLPYLIDEGLVMRFPEGETRGHAGFLEWYDRVIRTFFDEVHEVKEVAVHYPDGPGTATVDVVVNWQARIWNPPAARSTWLGFDAVQTWTVVERDGLPAIATYAVNALNAMPGSASL
jgi:hypothetical protein